MPNSQSPNSPISQSTNPPVSQLANPQFTIAYLLLSPTYGMHLYTADLALRMADLGHQVSVVTTSHAPRDLHPPQISLYTPVSTTSSGIGGFHPRNLAAVRHAWATVRDLLFDLQPDVVHFTGPHLANTLLLRSLRRRGIPTAHTIHDHHPHHGAAYSWPLYAWNAWVRREADHILVHGQCYRQQLVDGGYSAERVTYTPLTHLPFGYKHNPPLSGGGRPRGGETELNETWPPTSIPPPKVSEGSASLRHAQDGALFFGRLEAYKGLDTLIQAVRLLPPTVPITIAGPGDLSQLDPGPLPPNITLYQGFIADDQALALFANCALVVLPYVEASQSALVAAAYAFAKPVIVTDTGALAEYVDQGRTGWVVPPCDAPALAASLQDALSNPHRLAEMGRTGRTWYDSARQSEERTLLDLYRALTARG